MRYRLYVERRVSSVVFVDAPDLASAIEQAEYPGETDDVDPAGEWEVLAVSDEHGQDVPLPKEAADGSEDEMGFLFSSRREPYQPGMNPMRAPSVTPQQRVARSRKLRKAAKKKAK